MCQKRPIKKTCERDQPRKSIEETYSLYTRKGLVAPIFRCLLFLFAALKIRHIVQKRPKRDLKETYLLMNAWSHQPLTAFSCFSQR